MVSYELYIVSILNHLTSDFWKFSFLIPRSLMGIYFRQYYRHFGPLLGWNWKCMKIFYIALLLFSLATTRNVYPLKFNRDAAVMNELFDACGFIDRIFIQSELWWNYSFIFGSLNQVIWYCSNRNQVNPLVWLKSLSSNQISG